HQQTADQQPTQDRTSNPSRHPGPLSPVGFLPARPRNLTIRDRAGRASVLSSATDQARCQVGLELVDCDTFLRRAVALADRHSMIIERIEVDRDAVRRADLFLSTVTLTD